MRLARYRRGGPVVIEDAPEPEPIAGGLLVQTIASGLCSGELMDWYMEAKAPHVLGHEVAGRVIWSDDSRFPEGSLVAPHHHAPCGTCEWCRSGRPVHCATWRRTRLDPGGMAERFAAGPENLADCHLVDDLRPEDAALAEPLACVAKSLRRSGGEGTLAVIGLGALGLMHLIVGGGVGYDSNPARVALARAAGLDARLPEDDEATYDRVIVCPGLPAAVAAGYGRVRNGGVLVLFAPLPPGEALRLDGQDAYFREITVVPSYSCGPEDMAQALAWIRAGRLRAEQVVSDFITLEDLPLAYERMKRGEILKAMVRFTP